MKLFSMSSSSLSRRAYSSFNKTQIRTRNRTKFRWKTSPAFRSLYRSISHLGDPDVSVVPALDEWIRQGKPATKWDLQRLITVLMGSKRFRHALEVSLWMCNGKRYPISPFDIGVRLKLILKNFNIEQAENYFNKIPEHLRTNQIYLAILNCYTISKSVDKAESIMQKARELGYADRPIWYNLMMNLYCKLGNREKLRELLAEMESKGVSYDQFTYSVCLSACAAASDAAGMDRVMSVMESDPSVTVHWQTLVTAAQSYLRIGSFDEAMQLLNKLIKQLARCSQRNVLVVLLLNLCAEAGKKEELHRIWESYKGRKVVNKVYISMIRSLIKFNDIEEVEKIFEEWESGALTFDFRVPNFLIDAYSTDGRVDKAEALIARVVSKGGCPLVTTWCHLAGGYMKKNQVAEALRSLRKAISACPPKFASQKQSLITCLEYLQNNECLEEAEELIKSLRTSGMSGAPASDEFCGFREDAGEEQDFEGALVSEDDEDVDD
ncbi:pentatricopeptide repeat-containing protein At2g20710, mitochondrial-like [Salvia miltiorrhiza]|uniref:pentatricopeptide repeat-containing protein At2g20710, mitochondrial-like n=1 Tax=Salvia miltiorrhiza TaxID=226208 RepID=UPI0025ABF702|nr:pentatricopeptide repeat-containing protein At2g20710, mitochondrial-like [Salvia miltiorrhiza]